MKKRRASPRVDDARLSGQTTRVSWRKDARQMPSETGGFHPAHRVKPPFPPFEAFLPYLCREMRTVFAEDVTAPRDERTRAAKANVWLTGRAGCAIIRANQREGLRPDCGMDVGSVERIRLLLCATNSEK